MDAGAAEVDAVACVDEGFGANREPDESLETITGLGASLDEEAGLGADDGAAGVDACAGLDEDVGLGAAADVDAGAIPGLGAGASAGVAADVDDGLGAGAGVDADADAGVDAGIDVDAGAAGLDAGTCAALETVAGLGAAVVFAIARLGFTNALIKEMAFSDSWLFFVRRFRTPFPTAMYQMERKVSFWPSGTCVPESYAFLTAASRAARSLSCASKSTFGSECGSRISKSSSIAAARFAEAGNEFHVVMVLEPNNCKHSDNAVCISTLKVLVASLCILCKND